jgi:hypothetical protein
MTVKVHFKFALLEFFIRNLRFDSKKHLEDSKSNQGLGHQSSPAIPAIDMGKFFCSGPARK